MKAGEVAIKNYRKAHPKQKKLPRPPVPVFPKSIERKYARQLEALVANAFRLWKKSVKPQVRKLDNDVRFDDAATVRKALADFERRLSLVFKADQVRKIVSTVASDVNRWSENQVNRSFSKIASIDLSSFGPDMKDTVASWIDQNTALIKNVEAQIRDDVSRVVNDGVVRGLRWEQIVDSVEEGLDGKAGVFSSVRNRAKLIARDQVATFNGSLTKKRMTGLGIDLYTWRSSDDSRVRPLHAELDDRVFSWSGTVKAEGRTFKPAPGNIFPGSEINCRCVADPYFLEEA